MNLINVFLRFPDQESCVVHLEEIRWRDWPCCPYCGSIDVARKKERSRIGRWNCHDCYSSFNVLSGTIFQKTRIPLQKWFLGIALMINAKKSLSSCQMARDLDMNQNSAWYMMHRIRKAMAGELKWMLRGIVELDETYVGGKPRWGTHAPGSGHTRKVPVIGALERGGEVMATVSEDSSGHGVLGFVREVVDVGKAMLMTDEARTYQVLDQVTSRRTVNHSVTYVDGLVHTNTIEGFWSHLKRAWFGQHHHYSKRHMNLYVTEACWKYNRRREYPSDTFYGFLEALVAPG